MTLKDEMKKIMKEHDICVDSVDTYVSYDRMGLPAMELGKCDRKMLRDIASVLANSGL